MNGSAFEGNDANLVRNGTGMIDWCTLSQAQLAALTGTNAGKCPVANEAPNLDKGIDTPSGQQDSAFTNGAKQDDNPPAIGSGGIPKNKDDLSRFYVAFESIMVGGAPNNFLYLAWERNNPNGASAHEGFEFNKKRCPPDCSANGITPPRTEGDLLIVYDFDGGAGATLSTRRWVTSGACEIAGNIAPCWGVATSLDPTKAEAKTNEAGAVVDPINPGAPRTQITNAFGEATVNLTATGILPSSGPCIGFGSAYVVSRSSGNSGNATMKDFIAPISVTVNSCQPATITVQKTDGTSPLAGATLGLYSDQAAGDPNHGVFDTADTPAAIESSSASANPCSTTTTGPCSWTVAGTTSAHYLVVETASPSGYDCCASPVHVDVTFSSTPQTISLGSITNTPTPRNVVIGKIDDDNPAKPLPGVTFKAVLDSGSDGIFGAAEQAAYLTTTKTCTTAEVTGRCTISSLTAGSNVSWWIVEDARPAGYDPDTTTSNVQSCTTAAGSPAVVKRCVRVAVPVGVGDIGPVGVTFANPRVFKTIVIVCQDSNSQLYQSQVQFESDPSQSTLGHGATLPVGMTEQSLCSLGGATYEGQYGSEDATTTVPQ